MPTDSAKGALTLEILLTALLLVLGFATYQVAKPIPDNAFEPLGAGFVPRAISFCLIGLAALNIAVRIHEWRRAAGRIGAAPNLRLVDTVLVLALTCVYVWVVSAKAIPFTLNTALFVTVAMAILFRNIRRVPVYAVVGLALGYGIQLASSTVFYVDI